MTECQHYLVSLLLDGCENLAMVGLVVGMLVRHLENADSSLDPFLTEPVVWSLEFGRVAKEDSHLAASSEGIESPERRKWSLREAAMTMTLRAEDERVQELQTLGETLVERASHIIEQVDEADATELEANGSKDIERQLATVRAWASSLDRDQYQVREAPEGLVIQATPPEEVLQALQDNNDELERVGEEFRLINRYSLKRNGADSEVIKSEELAADITTARELLEAPTSFSAIRPWDVPALVAAAAIEAYLLRGIDVPNDALAFVVDTVLRVANGESPSGPYEIEETYFEQGADRSAARVLPLLLMPGAEKLRAVVGGKDGRETLERVCAVSLNLAQAVANEVRLQLARGLDHLWATPCIEDRPCHHQVGWQITTEMMRDCVLGGWNPETGTRSVILLDEPITESLENTADDSILPSRLDASIRALAPAATANICVSASARDLLAALLAAQRRSLLNYEDNDMDQRGNHSLVSARAILALAQDGEDAAIYEHINAFAENSALLGNILFALAAAAEETPERAATARRIWPDVVRHVLDLLNSGRKQFRRDFHGEMALAALIPNATNESKYLYREIQEKPIVWWEPLALRPEIELWLTKAAGTAQCVDQLIGFLRVLPSEDQVRIGLPWVTTLMQPSPERIAKGSWLLADWLIETRSVANSVDLSTQWQKVVDSLVVEGVRKLAPYSE